MRSSHKRLPCLAAWAFISLLGRAAQGAEQAVPMTSPQLVSQIHHIDQMEIDFGRLAKERGEAAQVRRFGDLLIRDHRNADKRVLGLARRAGVPLVDVKHDPKMSAVMEELKGLSGAEFDRKFLAAMVDGHAQALNMLKVERADIADQGLKDLIGKLIPIIRQHHTLAAELRGEQKSDREG